MNKQELIDKLKKLLTKTSEIQGTEFDAGHDYGVRRAIVLTKQLEEQQAQINKPEKPAVPRYVADFYESIKDDLEGGVYELCAQFYEDESQLSDELYWWFKSSANKPIETLVKMRLYGYKVAEYKVALKSNGFSLGIFQGNGPVKTIFTRDELAEYGFNNLDEYEVTEVEDE